MEMTPDSPLLKETRRSYDPQSALSERETAERFEGAIKELPASYREAFVLRHVQDLSYEEISKVTGDTVGSLKVRVHRARKLLKEKLFPHKAAYAEDLLE